MKFWKKYGRGFLALILTIALVGSVPVIPGVFADETVNNEKNTETEAAEEETSEPISEEVNGSEETDSTATEEQESSEELQTPSPEQEEAENESEHPTPTTEETTGESENKITVQDEETSSAPYTMEVTFAGETLKAADANNITAVWKEGESKSLQVVLKRNGNVAADANKSYLLCIKVPELFYFNGLPDVSKITGAEQVTIVKNATPQVYRYNSGDTKVDLPGFSPYSGEIRILLNPSVDTITIPNMGVSFNQSLAGYACTSAVDQARKILQVNNPLQINLVAVGNTAADLDSVQYTEENVLDTEKVDSVQLTRGNLVTGGATVTSGVNQTSLDKFVTSPVQSLEQKTTTEGTIGYVVGTAGMNAVYCRTLTVEFDQPYVEKNGQKYYLKFDSNDTAFQNKKNNGSVKGYHATSVTYDATSHKFTYIFEDVYLELYQKLFYTPDFSWPEKLANDKDITEEYKIQGYHWKVTAQTGYTGDEAGWWAMYPNNKNGELDSTQNGGSFSPNRSEIKLVSSASAAPNQGIVTRVLSPNLTRKNEEDGVGALGFFDIHNEGAGNSPKVNITFESNTNTSGGAKYYVTKVNLPAYENSIRVNYTLEDDNKNTVTGTKVYTKTNISSPCECKVEDLRSNSNVGNDYYIKKVTYQATLRSASRYHAETAHAWRNRTGDCGLYYGYLEGDEGTSAQATMTIASVDKITALNSADATELTATEKSTVGTNQDNYIGFNINNVQVDNQQTTSITAGSSTTLRFSSQVSSEEFSFESNHNAANGYHVFKDGIIYICLPDGVSILGTNQVTVICGGEKKEIKTVEKLTGSECTVNNTKAYWWAIEVDNIKANAYKTGVRNSFSVQIQLDTNIDMSGVTWNFDDCVAVRAKNQGISWTDGGDYTSCRRMNTVSALSNVGETPETGLANYLSSSEEDKNSERLGINIYRMPGKAVTLNIARAEAKLDVKTAMAVAGQTSNTSQVKVTDANTEVQYQVTVSSEDTGYASDFSYYIPIVSENSAIDSSAFVVQKEINMVLQKAVEVTATKADNTENPFSVSYTTDPNLTSDTIRGETVTWVNENTNIDYSKVTAIRITTDTNAQVSSGSAFTFTVTLKADSNGFARKAGCVAQWRSFGHYTYYKNREETTNTYPSGLNGVKAGYLNDMTESATKAILDTSGSSPVLVSADLPTVFEKAQNLQVKKVTVSGGTQLIADSPESLTGTAANNQFQLKFGLTGTTGESIVLNSSTNNGQWSLAADSQATLQANVAFSTALTETTQQRYVDITVGNDDVDIIWRVELVRKVQPASADNSRIVTGEHYQVPGVETGGCEIGSASAFTALYVIDNYTPGNYTNQTLTWKQKDSNNEYTEAVFPKDTSVIMMQISEGDAVESYWYYKSTGTESTIDLTSFQRMGGSSKYSYATQGTASTTLRYLFVVNFEGVSVENAVTGSYGLDFAATAISGATNVDAPLYLTVNGRATYAISATEAAAAKKPQTEISYTVNSVKNDSFVQGKTMALVLTPENNSDLPKDAVLEIKENDSETLTTYQRNSSGQFIIPIGTITSGSKTITLASEMFPDTEKEYSMKAELYIANSLKSQAPMNGKMVASQTVAFKKAATEKPSLKVTGTRIATASEWGSGQPISINMKNIANGKLTVTAYSTQKVTDLLSSVSGIFNISSGTGVYDQTKTSTDKLVLNASATPGTYKLLFEVTDDDGQIILSEPYYIIVR